MLWQVPDKIGSKTDKSILRLPIGWILDMQHSPMLHCDPLLHSFKVTRLAYEEINKIQFFGPENLKKKKVFFYLNEANKTTDK